MRFIILESIAAIGIVLMDVSYIVKDEEALTIEIHVFLPTPHIMYELPQIYRTSIVNASFV